MVSLTPLLVIAFIAVLNCQLSAASTEDARELLQMLEAKEDPYSSLEQSPFYDLDTGSRDLSPSSSSSSSSSSNSLPSLSLSPSSSPLLPSSPSESLWTKSGRYLQRNYLRSHHFPSGYYQQTDEDDTDLDSEEGVDDFDDDGLATSGSYGSLSGHRLSDALLRGSARPIDYGSKSFGRTSSGQAVKRYAPYGFQAARGKRYIPGLESLILAHYFQDAEKYKRQPPMGFQGSRG